MAACAAAVLAWIVLGLAGTIALGSAWLLAAGFGRAFASLGGPASWAAGILGEFALVLGTSGAVALISPHLHSRSVDLAIIALPAVVGVLLIAVSQRLGRSQQGGRPASHPGVALSITTGALAVAAWVASRGPYYGIAWAMSGDARNHVAIIRGLLSDGGVTVRLLTEYPAGVNAFAAIVAGTGDRSGAAGQVILNDAHAVATTYVLSAIAIGTMLAAALMELLPRAILRGRRLPSPVVVTALIASAAAGSPLILGIALNDGFLSAYGALAVALAGVVLALRFASEPRSGVCLLVLVAGSALLTFVSWTVLAVVPAALLLAMVVSAILHVVGHRNGGWDSARGPGRALWWAAIGCSVATLGGITLAVVSALPKLEASLRSTGATRSPYRYMVVVLFLIACAAALLVGRGAARRQMVLAIVSSVAGLVTLLWLLRLSGPGITWSYYAVKTSWLVGGTLIWVPFAPFVLKYRDEEPVRMLGERALRTLAAASAATAALLLVGSATTAPEPLFKAASGWNQPSASVVDEAIRSADHRAPFVFWEWSDPGNDRLGNFWAVLAWASTSSGRSTELPGVPGGFSYWSYMVGSQTSELCTLVKGAPGIDVLTSDDGLDGELQETCPGAGAEVMTGK